ncbi:MAG: hypothetical protein QXV45_06545 [Candidatus Bathyarchaeia archaeon]
MGTYGIPRILLGTSPFIGAGQFGRKAPSYYAKFYLNPGNILGIIRRAYGLGIDGIQLLPYGPVVKAVERALEEGMELRIVGSVRLREAEGDISLLERLGAVAMIAHAEIADLRDRETLEGILNAIHETGRPAGLASHKPFRTLSWLEGLGLKHEILMVPVNAAGAFMDCRPEGLAALLKRLGKFVIAKKALAAGSLPPAEALTYVASLDCVNSVALGVASEKEVDETMALAKRLLA